MDVRCELLLRQRSGLANLDDQVRSPATSSFKSSGPNFLTLTNIPLGVDRYIEKFTFFLQILLGFGIKPLFVFDGARHPMKAGTHQERDE